MLCSSVEKLRMVKPQDSSHCHYFAGYAPPLKTRRSSHHNGPLIATTLHAMLLHFKNADGRSTYVECYTPLLKNCRWTHHRSLLTATTAHAMLLCCKTANGHTTTSFAQPLLYMLCSCIAKLRMVAPQESSHYHYFTCYTPMLKNC